MNPVGCRESEHLDKPSRRQLLSILLPAFNESAVLPLVYSRLSALADTLAGMGLDYELVFVNDGSRDATPEILDGYARSDPRVRAVHLTRNFGHQAAVTAGLSLARGDVVAIMDCDLQDPPEVLPEFLSRWREGYQVIYAVRRKRKESVLKRAAYWSFYRLLAAISELDIPLDSGDFCVMDRQAVDLLNTLPECQRFIRGLRSWVGLKQIGVEYERDARQGGRPAYTLKALVKLAMDGLVSFSNVPLGLVTRLGLLSVIGAVVLGVYVLIGWIFDSRTPRGWASLAGLVLLMSSVQLLSLGIIGEYLGRVFLEVKRRPPFLIARVSGGLAEGDEHPQEQTDGRISPAAGASDARSPMEV